MNIVIRKANAGDIDAVSEIYEHIHTADEQVMVLHTLVIDPAAKGSGYGRAFMEFYEKYAVQSNCNYLRIDTNERNAAARRFNTNNQ